MSLSVYKPNSLAYPSRMPGINFAHPAIAQGLRFSAVAMSGSPILTSLLNLGSGSVVGSPTAGIIAGIGPAQQTNSTTSGSSSFANNYATVDTQLTLAAIIWATNLNKNGAIISTDGVGGNGWTLMTTFNTNPTGLVAIQDKNPLVASTVALQANTPYFVAATINGSTIAYIVATNLATGQILTGSLTPPSTTGNANSGTYAIGALVGSVQNFGGNATNAAIAAAMYSTGYIGQQALLAWAADPWAFWYPRVLTDTMFDSLNVSAAAPPSQILVGGGYDWMTYNVESVGY